MFVWQVVLQVCSVCVERDERVYMYVLGEVL